jgi:hypothetical protein
VKKYNFIIFYCFKTAKKSNFEEDENNKLWFGFKVREKYSAAFGFSI